MDYTNHNTIRDQVHNLIEKLDELNTNEDMRYSWDWQRKFHRIIKTDNNHDGSWQIVRDDDHAFLFVSQETGDVYEAKGWNRRGKVIYNLLNQESRDSLYHELEVSNL